MTFVERRQVRRRALRALRGRYSKQRGRVGIGRLPYEHGLPGANYDGDPRVGRLNEFGRLLALVFGVAAPRPSGHDNGRDREAVDDGAAAEHRHDALVVIGPWHAPAPPARVLQTSVTGSC